MTARKPNAVELAQQLIRALQADQTAVEGEEPIDEEAIRERARRDAERIRKARTR